VQHGAEIALNCFNVMESHTSNDIPCNGRNLESGISLASASFLLAWQKVNNTPQNISRAASHAPAGPGAVHQVRLHDCHGMNERHPVHNFRLLSVEQGI
jgi:hypothetical protein